MKTTLIALLALGLCLPSLALDPPPPPRPVGKVTNIDSKLHFILISLSSHREAKLGDVYRVTRNGKFVGTIIVLRVSPTKPVSICKVDKAHTTGMDKNPNTGDIKVGDNVTTLGNSRFMARFTAVVITDPIVRAKLVELLKKPSGKFAPPVKFTKAELAKVPDLYLGDTKITDAGLKDIAKLQKLTSLHLGNTKITDAGLKEIAKMQQLTFLHLELTKITDAGLKDIAKLQNLERLWLNDTKITDAGLKDIAKLQNLTRLGFERTKITDAGVAELTKALPKCEILH